MRPCGRVGRLGSRKAWGKHSEKGMAAVGPPRSARS
jgi:hypothetical protein